MQQVLRNVLDNAIRFAPAETEIRLAGQNRGAAGIAMTVQDSGPGIPEDELESIFEAFVQSSRTRDGSGGTGLGLTVCRKIMAVHGGSIHASSDADGGTVMHLALPAARLPDAAPSLRPNDAVVEESSAQVAALA
jgi:signal transduction histidine kinase